MARAARTARPAWLTPLYVLLAAFLAEAVEPRPFDCIGARVVQVDGDVEPLIVPPKTWSYEERKWCCNVRGIGCDSEQNTSADGGCDTVCVVDGQQATCRDRIAWTVKHQFVGEPNACGMAVNLVRQQCANCTACQESRLSCTSTSTSTSSPLRPQSTRPIKASDTNTTSQEVGEEFKVSSPEVRADDPLYDCETKPWEWSKAERDWCCSHKHRGCLPTTDAPSQKLSADEYGCDGNCKVDGQTFPCTDRIKWAATHEFAGKQDACYLAHRGVLERCSPACSMCALRDSQCLEEKKEPDSAACSAQCAFDGRVAPCKNRIRWSAEHTFAGRPRACSLAHELVVAQCGACSDCSAAQAGCQEEARQRYECDGAVPLSNWTSDHKAWCCKYEGRGCNGTTAVESEAAPSRRPSVGVEGRSPTNTTTDNTTSVHNCSAGALPWEEEWSAEKRAWCCEKEHRGCPSAQAGACQASEEEASVRWSAEKRRWCCKHAGRGCPATMAAQRSLMQPVHATEMVDCTTRPTGQTWSASVAAWCCLHKGLHCSSIVAREDQSGLWLRKFDHIKFGERMNVGTLPFGLIASLACGILMAVAFYGACTRGARQPPRNFQRLAAEKSNDFEFSQEI